MGSSGECGRGTERPAARSTASPWRPPHASRPGGRPWQVQLRVRRRARCTQIRPGCLARPARALASARAGSGTPVSGGGGAGLWASGQPQGPPVDVGRRRRLLPRSPGTGALLINCAVPSTQGWEPGAGLPVGGARAAEGTGSRRGVEREFPSKSGARSAQEPDRGEAVGVDQGSQ